LSPDELMRLFRSILQAEIESLKREFRPKELPTYLTRKQVAKMFDVNLSTIHAWSKGGKLSPVGIGNRVYFLREEVEQAVIKLQD
jgi:transposase